MRARLTGTRYYFEIRKGPYVVSGSVTFGKTADGKARVEVWDAHGALAWTSTGITRRDGRTAQLAFETWHSTGKARATVAD